MKTFVHGCILRFNNFHVISLLCCCYPVVKLLPCCCQAVVMRKTVKPGLWDLMKRNMGNQGRKVETVALWSGTNKNRDVNTRPLACPFAHSLAPLTRWLAPDCSLCSRPPLRSLILRSLTSLTPSLVGK